MNLEKEDKMKKIELEKRFTTNPKRNLGRKKSLKQKAKKKEKFPTSKQAK